MCECFVASLAAAEDALLAGALVSAAKADEEARLLVFLLLLQAVVGLPFGRFASQVRARRRLQTQLLLYHLSKTNKSMSGQTASPW